MVHQLLALYDGSNDLDVESTDSTNDPLNSAFVADRENEHQMGMSELKVAYFERQNQKSLGMR